MNKLFVFVRRRPGLDDARFWEGWRSVITQLDNDPSLGAERIVENRAIPGALVPEFTFSDYDGAYEFWFSDSDAATALLGVWHEATGDTDAKLTTPATTIVLAVDESVQFDRGTAAAVKFMALSRRAPTFRTRDDWIRYWVEVHGPLAHGIPEFTRYYHRYVHNYVVPSAAGTGGFNPPWDGIVEEWVDSADAFARCLSEPKYLEFVRPDELRFVDFSASHALLVEEHDLVP